MKKLLMEFLGTFFFVLTFAATGSSLAIAAMLMAWVYIGGYISGAHYNPMVSLAVALRGRLSWHDAWRYMGAQTLGGFAAYAIASFLHAPMAISAPMHGVSSLQVSLLRGSIAIPAPALGVSLLQASLVEILLAFVLALIILVVATEERFKQSHIFGFAIGFTIPALAALGGPISGGLFNPAIAIGANLFGALKGLPINGSHLIMYVAGAFIGGFLAACAFKFFFDDKVNYSH